MPAFPSALKPVVNQGYDFSASDNVIEQPVQGGKPLYILDYATGPVVFNVSIVGDRLQKQVFNSFYYGLIASGSGSFTMDLDSGNGLEEHNCQIIPSTVRNDGSGDPTWIISFQIIAETTPIQSNSGNIAELYEVYGDGITDIFDALADFTLVHLPSVFT